jgi:hypothetical protein
MRASTIVRFLVSVAALVLSVACSSQGEGEFCDTANGNDDCQSGLICVEQAPGLSAMNGVAASRCCPSDSTQATTSACMANVAGLPGNNDVGDATTMDAPSEAHAQESGGSADASDAAADAPHDSSSSDGTADHVAPGDGSVEASGDTGLDRDASDGAPD